MALHKWQEECLEMIENENAIVSAPTGAGKTKVAYIWMNIKNAIAGKHKIFYTVPIKALANEKFRELQELFGEEYIGIETGDVKKNTNASLIVCTQEVYTKKYARRKFKAKIVIDEFHYIFKDQKRSRAYIDAVRYSNHNHKFLIMSATFGNAQKVKNYLNSISDRDFVLYETDFRPTEIEYLDTFYTVENIPPNTLIYMFNIKAIDYLANLIASHKQSLPLLKRRKIKRLADKFKISLEKFPELSKGVAKYHSKMTYTEKKFIEELVRQNYIAILLATDALGVGVNLPIEFVLFANFQIPNGFRTTRRLTKTEFVQLSGRAGRKGYFDKGYVALLKHDLLKYEPSSMLLESYKRLLELPLEEPVIRLYPEVDKIVRNETTIEEEIEYIVNYSFPKRSYDEVKEELEEIQKQLENNKDVLPYMRDIFFPELDINTNAELIRYILSIKPKVKVFQPVSNASKLKVEIKEVYVDATKIPVFHKDEISTLLMKKKIAKTIDRKTVNNATIIAYNIDEITETIKKLDPLLLF